MAKQKNAFFIGDLKEGNRLGYRLAFNPNLAEARGFKSATGEESARKFDVTVLIPKTDKAGIKRIKDAVNKAIDSTDWSAAAKAQVKKVAWDFDAYNDYCVMKDGDEKNARAKDEEKTEYEQRAGHYTLKATRKDSFGPPSVVNANAEPIPSIELKGAIQAGYWVNVSANVYCYDFNGKKGASIQFDAVQLVKEDEIFGQSNPFEALDIEPEVVETDGESPFNE